MSACCADAVRIGLVAGDIIKLAVYRQPSSFSERMARLERGCAPLKREYWSCTVRSFDRSQVVVTLPDGETIYVARWDLICGMTRVITAAN